MRKVGALAGAVLALTMLPAPSAAAAEVCSYNLSTGTYVCGSSAARVTSAALIGRLYSRVGYQGRVLEIRRYAGPCTDTITDVDLRLDLRKLRFPTGGSWADRVMSFRTFNNCDMRVYDDWDGGVRMRPSGFYDRDWDMIIGGRNWQRRVDLVDFS